MSPSTSARALSETARSVTRLTWESLETKVRARVLDLLLDAFANAAEGAALDPYPGFVEILAAKPPAGSASSTVWFRGETAEPGEAALVNGTLLHHTERDDGHPGASLHGAAAVVPAALAVAEAEGASPRDFLAAVVAGYATGIACGRALRTGIERHRLHPPAILGTLAAAAAAARASKASPADVEGALALAGCLAPIAPVESVPRGAPVKGLYGGWPSYVGVTSSILSRAGLPGPRDLLSSERDGLGAFLLHGRLEEEIVFRPGELLHVEVGDVRASFRERLGERGTAIESAVDALPEARSLRDLAKSLRVRVCP